MPAILGPNGVEPDPNNFDCINVAGNCFAGPVDRNGYVYVAAIRSDQATGTPRFSVLKSNDAFASNKAALNYLSGPILNSNGVQNVCYSKTDKTFYFSTIDSSLALPTVSIAAFSIVNETWTFYDNGGPSGNIVANSGTTINQLSDGSLRICYVDGLLVKAVKWSSNVWGTPFTIFTETSPRTVRLLVMSAISDSSDTTWIPFQDIDGGFNLMNIDVVPFSSTGTVGSVITLFANAAFIFEQSGGPSWYISSSDTLVFPYAYRSLFNTVTVHFLDLFLIQSATTAPSLHTTQIDIATNKDEWPIASFLSNGAESLFSGFLIASLFVAGTEQLWRYDSNSLTSFPNPKSIEWDLLTSPFQNPSRFGVEPDSCLAPAYLFNETAYGTLITAFAGICPELYYLQIGTFVPPVTPQAIMLSMGESMTDVTFPHMS